MKKLIVLQGENCGYCKKAKMLIKRALKKENKYVVIDIQFILEESEIGRKYMHKLVPAFYCDDELLFEGNPHMADVISALEKCFE